MTQESNKTQPTNHNLKSVKLKQLSEILGKSENSLRYHLKMGRFKPAYRMGRTMCFYPDEVIQQLKRSVAA